MLEQLPADWIETALRVTGQFEDSKDPLGAVTGDFDGMGISLGVLQWNIGSSSLQPLVANVGRAEVVAIMPHYGVDLWNACTSNLSNGLQIVRAWQVGSQLRSPVFNELKAFTHSPQFVAQQVSVSTRVAKTAFEAARAWASVDPSYPDVTKPLFCWFFDIFTQNGGLKHLTYEDVRRFMNANGTHTADAVICDWLAARTALDAGYRDAYKNATLWRGSVDDKHLSLLVLSYLRALQSRVEYRADTLNRKATVAIGQGWVHMAECDLRPIFA